MWTAALGVVLAVSALARADVPAGFDCKTRHLAMEYATKLQPFRSSSDFEELAAQLNLPGGDPGGATQCSNTTYDGPTQTFIPTFPTPTGDGVFFVDPDSGSDSNSGSIDHPFQSIPKALDATRQSSSVTRAIVLMNGTYEITSPIQLGKDDSKLTIQNYEGSTPILSGARKLKISWQQNTNQANVWVADLSGQNVKEITGLRIANERAVRARYPNGCNSTLEKQGVGAVYACQGYSKDGKVVDPNDGFGSSLLTKWVSGPDVTDDTDTQFHPDTPVRNTSISFQNFNFGYGGTCKDFDPPAGYWCGNQCTGGAPKPPGCIYRTTPGLTYDNTILPHAPYKKPAKAVVQAWHWGHWASWMFQVSSMNDTHVMFSKGGFQGARGIATSSSIAGTFFVENVMEELDMDNEFYYDEDEQKLYYYWSKGTPSDDVIATGAKTLVSINGTQEDPVTAVSLLGLTFQDTALTYLDSHSMPSGGDWALGKVAALFIRGTNQVTVDSCTFYRLDGNAVFVNGYARETVIQNSLFREIGDNMIALLGETKGSPIPGMGPDGTDGNQPRFTHIVNNFATRCGLFEKQSSFFFQGKSCQNVVKNNIFFHGPRAGMNFNDGLGGGTLVEGNLMFNTVMESGDHGPFNSWDRQPYITDVTDPPSTQKLYDEIRHNFFIGNYYGQEAVDNDDGSAYYETHHNYFAYAGKGMKNDFNGHSNHHHDNVYAYVGSGLGICGALEGQEDQFYNNKVIQLGSNAYASYDCGCLATKSCPKLYNNEIFTPDGKMGDICGRSLPSRQHDGQDVGTAVFSEPSDDQIIAWAREVLNMP